MVSVTLSVPQELKNEMDMHPEMNWSEIARQAIKNKLFILKKMDDLLMNSKLTQEDALIVGKKVNTAASKRSGA